METEDLILKILIPLLAFGAGVLGVRGDLWHRKLKRPTVNGVLTLFVGVLTTVVSVWSIRVSDKVDGIHKEEARRAESENFGKTFAGIKETADRLASVAERQEKQLAILREQSRKQEEARTLAEETRRDQMPVDSITVIWELSPDRSQALRKATVSRFPLVGNLSPAVSYKVGEVFFVNRSPVTLTSEVTNRFGRLLDQILLSVIGDLKMISGASIRAIAFDIDSIKELQIARNVVVSLKPQAATANFFYNRPVYFGVGDYIPVAENELPREISLEVRGAEFIGRKACQTEWKKDPKLGGFWSPCNIDLQFGSALQPSEATKTVEKRRNAASPR
jgi:hypothetical protein